MECDSKRWAAAGGGRMNGNKLTSWITWTLVVLALAFIPIGGNPDAKRLYDDLLANYNRLIRPVGNNSDRLTVKMGIKLSQLIDVVSSPFTSFFLPSSSHTRLSAFSVHGNFTTSVGPQFT